MTEAIERSDHGAIIYDPQVISRIDDSRFTAAGWLHAEPLAGELGSGGRGNTLYVGNVPRQFVLRHFVRGGLVGRIVHDSYFWTGEDNTRPFVEWRLLAKLADRGLRVPRPAAARYCRRGPIYTADMITVRIPDVQPLSTLLAGGAQPTEFWRSLGAAIRQFHAGGVYHADMNAYNLQIDADGDVWMIDFDRGRLLPPGPWQQKTLARLHRSLQKIRALQPQLHFRREDWEQLLEGYFAESSPA